MIVAHVDMNYMRGAHLKRWLKYTEKAGVTAINSWLLHRDRYLYSERFNRDVLFLVDNPARKLNYENCYLKENLLILKNSAFETFRLYSIT